MKMEEAGAWKDSKPFSKENVKRRLSDFMRELKDDISPADRAMLRKTAGVALLATGITASPAHAGKKSDIGSKPHTINQILKRDSILLKSSEKISEEALECVAQNVYHEARGEPLEGRLAVALVTFGRAISGLESEFGDGVCGVVHHSKQFSWTFDKKILAKGIDDAAKYIHIKNELKGVIGGQPMGMATRLLSMRVGLPTETLFYRREGGTYSEKVEAFFSGLVKAGTIGKHEFFTRR